MIVVEGIDVTRFNIAAKRYVEELGMEMQGVVLMRAGLLKKRLVAVSPPKDRKKTQDRITKQIKTKFVNLGQKQTASIDETFPGGYAKSGSDVYWYRANRNFLYGINDSKLNLRNADVDTVIKLAQRLRTNGSIQQDFRHPRTHQRIIIKQRILTSKATVNRAIAKINQNIGKLKAGWAVNWQEMGIKGTLPQWIARHIQSQKERGGASYAEFGIKGQPTFTIINASAGVSKMIGLIKLALQIEARAMQKDVELRAKGVKL